MKRKNCYYEVKDGFVMEEEDGVGVIELALILVVLIALVLVFKSQLTSLLKNIFSQITNKSNAVY